MAEYRANVYKSPIPAGEYGSQNPDITIVHVTRERAKGGLNFWKVTFYKGVLYTVSSAAYKGEYLFYNQGAMDGEASDKKLSPMVAKIVNAAQSAIENEVVKI